MRAKNAFGRLHFLFLILALAGGIGIALADTPAPAASGGTCDMDALYKAIMQSESSGNPNICVTAKSGTHCCGLYQLCDAERAKYGLTAGVDSSGKYVMTSSVSDQQAAMAQYTQDHIAQLQARGAFQYVGQTINGVYITESGIIGAAHLGGVGGAMNFLQNGGNASDGHTTVGDYMAKFAGYSTPAGGAGGSTCGNGTGSASGGASGYQQLCDQNIRAQVSAQVDAATAKVNDYITTKLTPPPTLSQISNNPCASKELTRITNQFAYAPSRYSQQLTGGLIAAGGPISGIMQNLFKSEFDSINSAAASIPSMLNFQSMASSVMGSLMSSLGLGDAFSSQVCGLMVDMLLKYIQCEAPINLPNLGNIFGSLNNLLPNNCAGSALKSTLYDLGNSSALKTMSQPVSGTSGSLSLAPTPK